MLNFKKVLNLKLIFLIISIQFLFNPLLYPHSICNDKNLLRVPVGQEETYGRLNRIASNHTQPTLYSAKPWTHRFVSKFRTPITTLMLFLSLGGTPDSAAGSIFWEEGQTHTDKPIITEVIKPNQENLSQLFTQLGYPEKVHPLLVKELNEFLFEINFVKLQKELAMIKESNDQAELNAFLEKLMQKVRGLGYANPKRPKRLLRLLVNSLYGEDILNLLEEANIPEEKKRQLQEDFFSCVPLSHLADILLRLMGFEVKDAVAPEHVFTLITLNDNKFLLADFSLGLIMPLNLQQIYEAIGKQKKYWILSQEFHIDPGDWRLTYVFMRIKRQITEKKFDLQTLLRSKELSQQDKLRLVLNAFYFYIHIADSKSLKFSIYHHFGTILAEQGKLNEAIEAYNGAIQCNPDYAEAYYDLGTTLVELGRIDEGIKAYNEAVGLNPTYAQPYYNLGVIHLKLGDQDEGIKCLVKAVRLKPDLLNLLPQEIKNEVIKNLSLNNQLEIDKKSRNRL